MNERPDLSHVRDGLRNFQRDTVDYVVRNLYDTPDASGRFLIADEVGLGKTFVAKGVIAEVIDRFWDTDTRVDIVYLCSNTQIARQNINRLNPLPDKPHALADRLTLLPKTAKDLASRKVNLLAFTPGTSLDLGYQPGREDERRVLFWLLRRAWGSRLLDRDGAIEVLRAGVGHANFARRLGNRSPAFDPGVVASFREQLALRPDLKDRFAALSDGRRGGRSPGSARNRDMNRLIGELRNLLAQSCIQALEPDLVILDEFQRFSSILDGTDEASQLAKALFEFPDVRVLLMSATPYRMLTLRGDDPADGDHFKDLIRTTRFLLNDDERADALRGDLLSLRQGLAQGAALDHLQEVQGRIQSTLRTVMVRTERLGATPDRGGMLSEPPGEPLKPTAQDVLTFMRTEQLSRTLKTGGVVDYWKSSPYLLTFLDGYALRRKLDASIERYADDTLQAVGGTTAALSPDAVMKYKAVDAGHPVLRTLVAQLDAARAFELLWLPPALPTTELSDPYSEPAARAFTKRLVFSAWTAVPRAVASLLSMEAERRLMGGPEARYDKRTASARLALAGARGEPSDMPVFALLQPIPLLARLGDPRLFASEHSAALPTDPSALLAHVAEHVKNVLAPHLADAPRKGQVDRSWYWVAALLFDDDPAWFEETWVYEDAVPLDDASDKTTSTWLSRHAEKAAEAVGDLPAALSALGRPPEDLLHVLAATAAFGPANLAYRALDAVVVDDERRSWSTPDDVLSRDRALRDGAAHIALALRSLFQQPEAEALVSTSVDASTDYWRAVLSYSQRGGLPAVVEENLHVLTENEGLVGKPWDQTIYGADWEPGYFEVGGVPEAFARQIQLRSNAIKVVGMRRKGRHLQRQDLRIRHHFAVRHGQDRLDEKGDNRAENVRDSFNSPFWPFVLTSTSVGQEGLDFHPYSHAVVHWNLPHNPVDLEQREGRVHRYKGHAVRKNVAAVYGGASSVVLARDAWAEMFELASADSRAEGKSDLTPFWVFPIDGGATIERHVPLLALSKDIQRFADLKRTLALYRLSFGQPRQEELLSLLESAYAPEEIAELLEGLRLDLSPAPVGQPAEGGSKLT